MQYYSNVNKQNVVSFRDAVLSGLAGDGGLFLPVQIPKLEPKFFADLKSYSFREIAFNVSKKFVENEIDDANLQHIIEKAITFPAPLEQIDDHIFVLELFHGPTLAFKDFGARFMARVMEHFVKNNSQELNILVATSGDTGSAVASGFLGVNGIKVYVLYPSKKISEIQEKQITTLDQNIIAIEVEGTFDDCQEMVKSAFVDKELTGKKNLSSANSINIARLIPQSFYYIEAYKQLNENKDEPVISVPSGNLGNLTAGLFAKEMGLPVHKFIAATNSNDVFTEYVGTGKFSPRPSVKTYSNAMDVGNPSNIARINELYKHNIDLIRSVIFSRSFSDSETLAAIKNVFNSCNYLFDPHGAVGYLALEEYYESTKDKKRCGIVLETAHPGKFNDVVEKAIGKKVELPDSLKSIMHKEKKSIAIKNNYTELKEFILNAG